jgi:hypothetical protein
MKVCHKLIKRDWKNGRIILKCCVFTHGSMNFAYNWRTVNCKRCLKLKELGGTK